MFKFKFFLIYLQVVFSSKEVFQSFINCDQQNCAPQDNNFIRALLLNFTQDYKLEQINQMIPQYSKIKMQVMKTKQKGMGVFLNQTINSWQKIFSYQIKKCIGGGQINQKIFKQNSLYIGHKKIRINQYSFIKLVRDPQISISFMFILNLFYHFCRFQDSFLRNDLIAIPTELNFPYFQITSSEFRLIQSNIQYAQIKSLRKSMVNDFNLFQISIKKLLSQEQFLYYFGRQEITFDEFLFLSFIINTRQHFYRQHRILFPIMHYLNQAENIQKNQYRLLTNNFQKQLDWHHDNIIQYENTEFVFDYGYDTMNDYAFKSGFIPKISDLECFSVLALSQEESEQYNIDQHVCIDDNSIKQLTYIFLQRIDSELIDECLNNSSPQLYNSLKDPEQQDNAWYQLWKECETKYMHLQDQPFDIWRPIILLIKDKQDQLQQNISNLEIYLEQKIKKNENSSLIQLLIDHQKYYLDLTDQAYHQLMKDKKNKDKFYKN